MKYISSIMYISISQCSTVYCIAAQSKHRDKSNMANSPIWEPHILRQNANVLYEVIV